MDKFGNIEDPVFSPRLIAMFKPLPTHSLRASYNRAFQSPSVVNNYLDQPIIGTGAWTSARSTPALPLLGAAGPVIQPIVTRPFPLIVNNIGNANLKEQSLTPTSSPTPAPSARRRRWGSRSTRTRPTTASTS